MTTPHLPIEFSGAVGEGFSLPWNRTVTLADVWAAERKPRNQNSEAQRAKAMKSVAARRVRQMVAMQAAVQRTVSGKLPFAGYDATDTWNNRK